MNSSNPAMYRRELFRVRPIFLLACATLVAVVALPDVVHGSHILKRVFLLLAGLALASGWFFLLSDREPNSAWRAWIALLTSVYLTVSLPVFLFELSQIKWLMHHPHHYMFEMYVWPWVRWGDQGYLPVLLGVAGSFLGRGRARMAFVVGSILLLILRASMGTWVL